MNIGPNGNPSPAVAVQNSSISASDRMRSRLTSMARPLQSDHWIGGKDSPFHAPAEALPKIGVNSVCHDRRTLADSIEEIDDVPTGDFLNAPPRPRRCDVALQDPFHLRRGPVVGSYVTSEKKLQNSRHQIARGRASPRLPLRLFFSACGSRRCATALKASPACSERPPTSKPDMLQASACAMCLHAYSAPPNSPRRKAARQDRDQACGHPEFHAERSPAGHFLLPSR